MNGFSKCYGGGSTEISTDRFNLKPMPLDALVGLDPVGSTFSWCCRMSADSTVSWLKSFLTNSIARSFRCAAYCLRCRLPSSQLAGQFNIDVLPAFRSRKTMLFFSSLFCHPDFGQPKINYYSFLTGFVCFSKEGTLVLFDASIFVHQAHLSIRRPSS